MMTGGVSEGMLKILIDSQNKLLTVLSKKVECIADKQDETNVNIKSMVGLLREEVGTNKQILKQHIIEYNRDKLDYKVRFKNLFKRQDKIDGIIKDRAPAWFAYQAVSGGIKKGLKIFVTAIIILLAGYFGLMMGFK